jgi:hypothetical protein
VFQKELHSGIPYGTVVASVTKTPTLKGVQHLPVTICRITSQYIISKAENAQFQVSKADNAQFQVSKADNAQFQVSKAENAQFQVSKVENAQFQISKAENAQFQALELIAVALHYQTEGRTN